MVDLQCQRWRWHRPSELDAVEDALSANYTRAESCLLQDYVEAIGQSCSRMPLLHTIHMRMSGYYGQRTHCG